MALVAAAPAACCSSPAPTLSNRLPCASRCRGLDAVRGSQRVYLEAYTSLLLVPKEKLVRGRGGPPPPCVPSPPLTPSQLPPLPPPPPPLLLYSWPGVASRLPSCAPCAGGVLRQGGDCGGPRDGGDGGRQDTGGGRRGGCVVPGGGRPLWVSWAGTGHVRARGRGRGSQMERHAAPGGASAVGAPHCAGLPCLRCCRCAPRWSRCRRLQRHHAHRPGAACALGRHPCQGAGAVDGAGAVVPVAWGVSHLVSAACLPPGCLPPACQPAWLLAHSPPLVSTAQDPTPAPHA